MRRARPAAPRSRSGPRTGPEASGPLEALAAGARSILGEELTGDQLGQLNKYLDLLAKWQRVHRLVGSTEPRWLVDNVILDSLLFLKVLPPAVHAVADVGSGAGVPGVPIRIVRPGLSMALVEPRERRASFLAAVVRELDLAGTRVHRCRAADLADAGERVDAVVMRCAGDVATLIPEASRLLAPGGLVVASGPPAPRGLPPGVSWVEVEGLRPGGTRRFAVYRDPRGQAQ